ncbi:sensor domain-containing diguanylate cyclase [Enterobacter pasteurii]|uniref:diguanylate cyclase n=1 Tax=Enterobacter cloacae TaxID=550 RepID=A0A7H8UHY1_ENTCL|nr:MULTISPECIES: sensor domain-containing diguanylate cyclase [Enterobacter cloacae complex]MCM7511634.1 sensor domain-containing diguanylate cyclase [Enterobacter hormaechei]MCY0774326.1 sensor domain-containing diguanylate cyclase [Enterobacter cloacae complex sp. 2022EL-00788]MDE4079538.1 sensor domain-containing diguanylate cyclase [Enterobacter pasteurii]QKZ99526.1 sensor domain-containing diguanylate cyclase [Enterobacter cloacae]QLA66835.1 sensor domain-containing diguanylate cyclase [E
MSDIILARVSETLSTEQSLDSLVRQLLEMLEIVTDMESTYLTKVDIDARLQHILYARNSKQMQIPEGFSVPWDETLCKRAIDSDTLFSNEVPDRWPECVAAKALGITTYMSVPVHLADGSLYGTLCAASTEKKLFSDRGEQVIRLFAGLIAQYIQKESLVLQLREANAALIAHSYTDALTGLPNRRAIFENLTTLFSLARHLQRNVTIAFIDLDDFKRINDHYGHEAGDRFLIQVGARLTDQQTQDEIIGRLGGDEFLVACLSKSDDGDTGSEISAIKTSLNDRIAGEYGLGNVTIRYPGASIGVIIVDPHSTDEDSALRTADVAMYQDKKGKSKTGFVALD